MIPRYTGPALPEGSSVALEADGGCVVGGSGSANCTGASLPGDVALRAEDERLLELAETQSESNSSAFVAR